MKGSKIPRVELNTVYLYQHYSLFMHNKLHYPWRGDYCQCVRPAQLPVLTWSSSSVLPGTISTICYTPGPHMIQHGAMWRLVFKGRFTHSTRYPCRAHAAPLPFPCHAVPLIHTCHVAPLPCSDSAVSFVKFRVVAGNIRTASPTV